MIMKAMMIMMMIITVMEVMIVMTILMIMIRTATREKWNMNENEVRRMTS